MRRWIAVWVFVMFTFSAFHPAWAVAEIDKPSPPLTGVFADGALFDLSAMKGKVVLVNFWASWCGPCREEMPDIEMFYRDHHKEGLEIIAISIDRQRSRNEVVSMMKLFTFPYVMFDNVTNSGFGMPAAIPVTYVIDRKGVVRARLTPETTPISNEVLGKTILPLLKS